MLNVSVMKKLIGLLVLLATIAIVTYSIITNGFDIVVAAGTLMISAAIVISFKIFQTKPKSSNEVS